MVHDIDLVPKQRPKTLYKNRRMTITPWRTWEYEHVLKELFHSIKTDHLPLGLDQPESVNVEITFLLPIPSSIDGVYIPKKLREDLIGHDAPMFRGSDIDNLEKAVYDAGNGVLWADDKYISRGKKKRMYWKYTGFTLWANPVYLPNSIRAHIESKRPRFA